MHRRIPRGVPEEHAGAPPSAPSRLGNRRSSAAWPATQYL